HDAKQSFNAVIDIHEGSRLFAVAPDFDLTAVFGKSHFAADRSGRFLFATFVCTERTVNVVRPNHARLESVILVIVMAHLLGKELFPAIARLGIGGNRILLAEWRDVGITLLTAVVDAGGRCEQKTFYLVLAAGLEHIGIEEHVITGNIGV